MGVLQEVQSNSHTVRRGVEFASSYKRFIFVGVCLAVYATWALFLSGPVRIVRSPPTSLPVIFDTQRPSNLNLKSRLEDSEKVWQRYKAKREAIVRGHPELVNPWPPAVVMYYWDYFLPTFTCPHLIERVGGLGDGGKWVCGVELYEEDPTLQEAFSVTSSPIPKKSCVIYALGVAHEYSFEEEILGRIKGCQVYGYDASVDSMGSEFSSELQSRIHFHKQYVGVNNTATTSTLKAMMERNGHQWIDILKMDVEGAEFAVLDQIMDDFEILPFSQMQLEVHGDTEGKNFKDFYKSWERMESKGIRAFKNEMNHWPSVRRQMKPIYAEYSFINIKGCEFNRLIC